jgi:hypothetical protein
VPEIDHSDHADKEPISGLESISGGIRYVDRLGKLNRYAVDQVCGKVLSWYKLGASKRDIGAVSLGFP